MSQAPVFETPARAPITAAGAVLAAIVIAGLYFGRDILVPLALATLLVFVLTPPLQWLRRRGLPKVIAVILVTALAAVSIGGVLAVVGTQLVQLAEELPGYQTNIKSKLADLRTGLPGGGLFSRVSKTIDEIGKDLRDPAASAPSVPRPQTATEEAEQEPIPVTITSTPLRPLEVLQTYVDPILTPLATAALVVLFVIFILIEREELRDRFIALVGAGDVQRSTEAIMDAADRVSRYLLMQLIVNVTYGVAIGAGLWLIGVPNAILWGILAGVLRFIPYLGPWLAAIMPILLAFATAPGWTMVLMAVGLFVVIELLSNNVMEPMLYGSTTGLSSFAIILAAISWTLIWGPIGLLLATPLTVCLVVVGRYVPRLEFLDLLLGSTPVLSPPERLYQRLLTGNIAEALELTEQSLDTLSTAAFIEDVAMPALRLAERDRERGANPTLRRNVAEGVDALMGEVELEAAEETERAEAPIRPLNILCIGGRTELDQSAAAMLAAYFRSRGHRVEVKAPLAISPSLINQLDPSGFDLVALCYLERRPERHARNICRRLARQSPDVALLVCCFNLEESDDLAAQLQSQLAGKALVATSMAGVNTALDAAGVDEIDDEAEARGEATLAEVLTHARQLRLDAGTGDAFAALSTELAPVLEESFLLVALIDGSEAERPAATPERPLSQQAQIAGIVRERTKDGETRSVVVPSVATDKELSTNELLLEKGIRFFAAAPILSTAGHYAGALCVLDADERTLDAAQIEMLENAADALGRKISDTAAPSQPAEAAQPRYRLATSS
ncbi:MAG: AI-2E family transporter [Hyphomicrobiaceae bacterium]